MNINLFNGTLLSTRKSLPEGSSEKVNKIKILKKNEANRIGIKLLTIMKLQKTFSYCKKMASL